nr:PepSY domain-containing protein [uncultured Selenomonas sp.]
MKKWQMAAPVAGALSFGALAALGVGIFQGQTTLHAPVPQTAAVSAPAAWGRDSLFISVAEAAAADFMSYDTIKVQAIAESGLREGDLTNYEIKFDGRGYMPTYRVELETNAGGVDIDFDAKTGEIIDVREKSWKHSRTKLVISDYDVIEDVEAMGIALEDADLSMDDLDRFELELHTKRGELVYSVELKHGTEEYEYDLRASDGTILKREIDFD